MWAGALARDLPGGGALESLRTAPTTALLPPEALERQPVGRLWLDSKRLVRMFLVAGWRRYLDFEELLDWELLLA